MELYQLKAHHKKPYISPVVELFVDKMKRDARALELSSRSDVESVFSTEIQTVDDVPQYKTYKRDDLIGQLRSRAAMSHVDELTIALLEAAASVIETPDSIDDYAVWARKMWMSDKIEERDITIMSLGLPGETGEVIELLKKRVRDGNLDYKNLKKELGDVLYYWAMLCVAFGFKPSEVIETNQEKINSRFARGTMSGSGDDR